jgi:hypothetical protein
MLALFIIDDVVNVLQKIWCVISHIPCYIVYAAIGFVNLLAVALGALVSGVLFLLPSMPSIPSLPNGFTQGLGWISWFFPIGTVFDVLAALIGLWVVWQAFALVLRWVKYVD